MGWFTSTEQQHSTTESSLPSFSEPEDLSEIKQSPNGIRPLRLLTPRQAYLLLQDEKDLETTGRGQVDEVQHSSFLPQIGMCYMTAGTLGVGYGLLHSMFHTRGLPWNVRFNSLFNQASRYGSRYANISATCGTIFCLSRWCASGLRDDITTTTLAGGITAAFFFRTRPPPQIVAGSFLGLAAAFLMGTWKGEKIRASDLHVALMFIGARRFETPFDTKPSVFSMAELETQGLDFFDSSWERAEARAHSPNNQQPTQS